MWAKVGILIICSLVIQKIFDYKSRNIIAIHAINKHHTLCDYIAVFIQECIHVYDDLRLNYDNNIRLDTEKKR